MGKMFDIFYMLAKENLSFRKYPAIHELESQVGEPLGADLGQSYARQAPQVSTSTFAVEQESEGELPFCFSLLEWDQARRQGGAPFKLQKILYNA